MKRSAKTDAVYITGLGHEYPPHTIQQEDFAKIIESLYPGHYLSSPGIQKLVDFNTKTQIKCRPTVSDNNTWTQKDAQPPSLTSLSRSFRTKGLDLATAACTKAMSEAGGNPGYDLFVSERLGLGPSVQRVLVQGVGCAGGLSALRAAADIAAAAALKRRCARVLVSACELCSLFFRTELHNIVHTHDQTLHIAPALFSDAAAALVVCNGLALQTHTRPVFQLAEWASSVVPGTSGFMSYHVEKNGMIATISKDVPKAAISAIAPMFQQLCNNTRGRPRKTPDLDWALHPGGAAILHGAKHALHLSDSHIRASLDVYRNHGNSSSASVLIVLDTLRRLGPGRDDVAAVSFGPGLTVEMCIMSRCRGDADSRAATPPGHRGKMASFCGALYSRLSRKVAGRHAAVVKDVS
ncbi:uncharacterized protein SETTUDRAFT_170296 [Exserohilum turcica Et28A]|uniref:Thiolase-like protein n=1 Tax=Exserohilum turcicum (strain 28A) TaxID=671987 RepID=R0KEQ2_EXST2|nr:uncharacterized protein SETTUDRAFT_170296 [Exserohilum turcica Et28A]EOA91343.1 hypothetical protein SETTUDRAFT_170296 [Exserohilum turcica Et28A]